MKKSTVFFALSLSAALVMMTSGCKHREIGATHIPGQSMAPVAVPNDTTQSGDKSLQLPSNNEPPVVQSQTNGDGSVPFGASKWDGTWAKDLNANREILAKDIIYFDTDASSLRPSEQAKLDDIIKYFSSNSSDVLMVEGYCDERGTEGYNMSLGDRRALAIREYLATHGVESGRIHTVSFGEQKPVDPGHNEAAWKKNRRGEPVVMQPKQ